MHLVRKNDKLLKFSEDDTCYMYVEIPKRTNKNVSSVRTAIANTRHQVCLEEKGTSSGKIHISKCTRTGGDNRKFSFCILSESEQNDFAEGIDGKRKRQQQRNDDDVRCDDDAKEEEEKTRDDDSNDSDMTSSLNEHLNGNSRGGAKKKKNNRQCDDGTHRTIDLGNDDMKMRVVPAAAAVVVKTTFIVTTTTTTKRRKKLVSDFQRCSRLFRGLL